VLEQKVKEGNFNFENFIKSLSDIDKYDFMEDVLVKRTEDMQFAFPPSKNISTHAMMFHAMVKLPYSTYQSVKGFLDKISQSAIFLLQRHG
jgi:hypothetical protein